MRVLILHNRYRQQGGEDLVAQAEAQLLRAGGVEVRDLTLDNDVTPDHVLQETFRMAWNSAWSPSSYEYVRNVCDEFRPDVAHVHNFWMKLSPSVHAGCHASGVPTVQMLHNFRLSCTNALLYRSGGICEDCLGHLPWKGVIRRCYRNSTAASAAVAAMIIFNRARGTWQHDVDAFIALSEHSRGKFIAGGLPGERIFVKPNFVDDPGPSVAPSSSKLVLYAGRISPEKGLNTLLVAWARGGLGRYGRLLVAGDGPDRAALEQTAASLDLSSSVEFLGRLEPAKVMQLVALARAVVLASECYENFPRIIAEALAHGRPAIVSDIGALAEIVNGRIGVRFPARDASGLSDALLAVLRDGALADKLGSAARAEYLAKYTPARNYDKLMDIYEFVLRGPLARKRVL